MWEGRGFRRRRTKGERGKENREDGARTRTADKGHIETGIYILNKRGSRGDKKQGRRKVWRGEEKTNHERGQQTQMAGQGARQTDRRVKAVQVRQRGGEERWAWRWLLLPAETLCSLWVWACQAILLFLSPSQHPLLLLSFHLPALRTATTISPVCYY